MVRDLTLTDPSQCPAWQQIKQRNQVRIRQMDATARSRFADGILVRRAVDVNVARVRIHVDAAVKSGSRPSSHKMRVVILASANSGCDVWPTALRALRTVPAGSPAPIFSAMRCNPNGVRFEPSVCPMPKREVEQGSFLTNLSFSKSETVCSAMLIVRMN